jgi:hypothetical protein
MIFPDGGDSFSAAIAPEGCARGASARDALATDSRRQRMTSSIVIPTFSSLSGLADPLNKAGFYLARGMLL